MSAIQPKENITLEELLANPPEHLVRLSEQDDSIFAVGETLPLLPRLSLRGKVWRFVDTDGTETPMVTEDGSPQSAIYVALVAARPGVSRNYFHHNYDPENTEGPTCFSTDGVHPHEKAPEPQAESCALCPMNRVGSRITDSGKKTRACGMKKEIVVVPCNIDGTIHPSAMPVRIGLPAVSAYNLDRLVKETKLKSRGAMSVRGLVLKLSFNIDAAFPEVVFTPVGLLKPEAVWTLDRLAEDEAVVAWISGTTVDTDIPPSELQEDVKPKTQPTTTVSSVSTVTTTTTVSEPAVTTMATPKRKQQKTKTVQEPEQEPRLPFSDLEEEEPSVTTTAKTEKTADRVASILERFKAFG